MNNRWTGLLLLLIVLAVALTACGTAGHRSQTPPAITATPTLAPLGSPANPLTLVVIRPLDAMAAEDAAADLSAAFLDDTGIHLQVQFAPTAQELLFTISKAQAQAAFLPPATYIYANERRLADIQLVANIYGSFYYGSQIFINIGAYPEVPIPADPLDETSALTALSLFNGKTPCYTSTTSLSGYILPLAAFRRFQMELKEPVFTQSFEAVIRSLYIKGICDLGATYAYSGDPRTAAELLDLPDILQIIQPVWKSPPIIPSLGFALLPGLEKDLREILVDFFIQWISEPQGREALPALTGAQIQDFRRVDDSVYDPLRQAIRDSGIPLEQLVGY